MMEEKQKLIGAAQMIKEFCTKQGRCDECPFYSTDNIEDYCILIDCVNVPNEWELPNLLEQKTPAPKEPKSDAVNHPAHYTAGGVECIDAIEAATTSLQGIEAVCTANVIKYLWRWKLKNGIEDLKKAAWYLERLIKKLDPTWRQE